MAAMMPSGPTNSGNQTANPYDRYDAPTDGDDLIDPDDGKRAKPLPKERQFTEQRTNSPSPQQPSTTSTTPAPPLKAPPPAHP